MDDDHPHERISRGLQKQKHAGGGKQHTCQKKEPWGLTRLKHCVRWIVRIKKDGYCGPNRVLLNSLPRRLGKGTGSCAKPPHVRTTSHPADRIFVKNISLVSPALVVEYGAQAGFQHSSLHRGPGFGALRFELDARSLPHQESTDQDEKPTDPRVHSFSPKSTDALLYKVKRRGKTGIAASAITNLFPTAMARAATQKFDVL